MSDVINNVSSNIHMLYDRAKAFVKESDSDIKSTSVSPLKKTKSQERLAAEIDRLYREASEAFDKGQFSRAASHARSLFSLFQGDNAAHRSQELSKIKASLIDNTDDKVDSYVGTKAKIKFGFEIASAVVTAGAGVVGMAGGVWGATAFTGAAVARAVAAGAQPLSYAGQAGTSICSSLNSFFEADRTALDGSRGALQTEQDETSKKRESASGAKREIQQLEDQIARSREQTIRSFGG